ncbi:MAG: response regulator transcription factor [Verrucomicrobiales bacterium]|jgi:DNA-binding NarL/FixJ family response regulator|nr:response regulator transcription factor [Verrucomicrobiales bacterium]
MEPAEFRIALVEDDRRYLRVLEDTLHGRPGWRVVARCAGAAEALSLIPVSRPDLILFDLSLDGALRLDVVVELKRRLPQVPLVALTVEDQPAVIVRVIQSGASGYLLKSDDRELCSGVEDIRAGGAPVLSAAVARRLWEALRMSPPPAMNPGVLTEREWQVLQLAARGKQHGEISAELGIAVNTVKNHFRHIYEKLGVGTLTEAVVKVRGGRGLLDG